MNHTYILEYPFTSLALSLIWPWRPPRSLPCNTDKNCIFGVNDDNETLSKRISRNFGMFQMTEKTKNCNEDDDDDVVAEDNEISSRQAPRNF